MASTGTPPSGRLRPLQRCPLPPRRDSCIKTIAVPHPTSRPRRRSNRQHISTSTPTAKQSISHSHQVLGPSQQIDATAAVPSTCSTNAPPPQRPTTVPAAFAADLTTYLGYLHQLPADRAARLFTLRVWRPHFPVAPNTSVWRTSFTAPL